MKNQNPADKSIIYCGDKTVVGKFSSWLSGWSRSLISNNVLSHIYFHIIITRHIYKMINIMNIYVTCIEKIEIGDEIQCAIEEFYWLLAATLWYYLFFYFIYLMYLYTYRYICI